MRDFPVALRRASLSTSLFERVRRPTSSAQHQVMLGAGARSRKSSRLRSQGDEKVKVEQAAEAARAAIAPGEWLPLPGTRSERMNFPPSPSRLDPCFARDRVRACDGRARGYAAKSLMWKRPSTSQSLAARCRSGARLGAFLGLVRLAACSTYGSDLLTPAVSTAGSGGVDAVGGVGIVPSGGGGGGSGPVSAAGSAAGGGSSSGAGTGTGGNGRSDAGAAGVAEESGGTSGASGLGGSVGAHAGAGGTTTSGGESGTGGTTAGSGGTPGIDMIDDFELNDPAMQVLLNNGRDGYWYPFHDATATGVQTFGIKKPADRAGSTYSAHMTATGFTVYGAGFGADFVAAKAVPYNVSAYKGIRFYAKIAAGTQSSLKMLIPTTYSDVMGGKCTAAAGSMQCTDHLFCALGPVTTAWTPYECDFVNLRQVGFGLKQPSLDPKSVYSVQFSFSTVTLAAMPRSFGHNVAG